MNILVTGTAGFIGFHLAKRLLNEGYRVIGLDNLNAYYSVELKENRLNILHNFKEFDFLKLDLESGEQLQEIFARFKFDFVVNMAAQAGVRYSIQNPSAYVQSNMVGFGNLLECCRQHQIKHLVFASSSSVYGLNTKMPFSERDNVDHPISLYAASKKSNELMAHAYSYLYRIPCTGLRFFTVYGPWGRPDMALFKFTKAILKGETIDVFNHGQMKRDFTYIDDIIEGVYRVLWHLPAGSPEWDGKHPDPSTSPAPYKIYNIGNNNSVHLERFIQVLENYLGKKAQKNYLPLQPGDVPDTYANVDDLAQDVGFRPITSIEEGIPSFVQWYREYYRV